MEPKCDEHQEKLNSLSIQMAYLTKAVERVEEKLDEKFVTHIEFYPVKAIVFGTVGLIVTSVFGAMIATVVMAGG